MVDNYLLIKIISGFVVLINDFNLDNLHKLQYTINQSANNRTISMDSTIDNKDDSNINLSIGLIDEDKSKKNGDVRITKTMNFMNINAYNNKNEIMNQILENKTNNSELSKLNISSSKVILHNNNSN